MIIKGAFYRDEARLNKVLRRQRLRAKYGEGFIVFVVGAVIGYLLRTIFGLL